MKPAQWHVGKDWGDRIYGQELEASDVLEEGDRFEMNDSWWETEQVGETVESMGDLYIRPCTPPLAHTDELLALETVVRAMPDIDPRRAQLQSLFNRLTTGAQ